MKCVRNISDNSIKRLSNEKAEQLVSFGTWKFIPKSEWKLTRPKVVANVVPEEVNEADSLVPKRKKQPGKHSAYRAERKKKREISKTNV